MLSAIFERTNSDHLAILIATVEMYQLKKAVQVQKAQIENFKRVEEQEDILEV